MDKLNIGCGDNKLTGYVNVDIQPRFNPDILADIMDVDFKNGRFIEIRMFDLIEHVSSVDGKRLLRKCYNWLQPGGSIIITTQNMRHVASLLTYGDDDEALRWIYGTFGEGETGHENGYHKWGYSASSLSGLLSTIGFQVLDTVERCNGYGLMVTAIKR